MSCSSHQNDIMTIRNTNAGLCERVDARPLKERHKQLASCCCDAAFVFCVDEAQSSSVVVLVLLQQVLCASWPGFTNPAPSCRAGTRIASLELKEFGRLRL